MHGAYRHHHGPCMLIILTVLQASTRAKDPIETPLEAWWAEHQGLASGAIKVASMFINASGMPGAGALAAVMAKVVEAAAGATENRESCKRLAILVRTCDIALADAGTKANLLQSGQAEELLEALKQAMEEAAAVAEEFGQKRGMVMRLVKYNGDADAFKQIHHRLDDCMKVGKCSSCLSSSLLIALPSCLQTFTFCLSVKLEGQVSSQLDTFGQRVTLVEERVTFVEEDVGRCMTAVSEVKRQLERGDRFAKEPPQDLPEYLLDWWFDKIGDTELDVDNDTFLNKLMDTMQSLG